MQRKSFYVLQCVAQGCTAEFYLNDQPVIRRGAAEGLGARYDGQCNHLVVPGENVVSAVIGCGPTPSTALTGRHGPPRERRRRPPGVEDEVPAHVECKLVRYPEGEVIGSPAGEVLVALTWDLGDDAPPRHWPLVISGACDAGSPFGGPWSWQRAEPLTLDDATREAVVGVVKEVRARLEAKDNDAFLEVARPRLAEIGRAYGLPAGQKEDTIRKNNELFMKMDYWGFPELDPADFDLRLCARRRMVDCVRRDWEPVLRENPRPPSNLQNSWPLRVAKVDGAWVIVR